MLDPSADSNRQEPTPQPTSRSRAPWKWLLRLALGAGIVWLLARGASQAPLEGIRRAPPTLLAACVAAYWAGQALSARRWQLLLNALAHDAEPGSSSGASRGEAEPISWRECVSWYAAGMFWNLWMPTGLGGDAARALLSGRRAGDGARGALSVVLDRALGLASLLLLALAALILDTGVGHASAAGAQSIQAARRVLLACAVAGAVLCLLLGLAARLASRSAGAVGAEQSGGWKGKLARAAALASGPGRWRRARVLGPIVLLSLGVQALQIAINIALAQAVGLPLEPASMAWIAPVLALSSVVPLGIGGLGAREAGAVALLGTAFRSGDVLAWSLLWQAVVWLSSLLGASAAWRWRKMRAAST